MNRAQIRLVREQLLGMNTYDLSPLQLRTALIALCEAILGPSEDGPCEATLVLHKDSQGYRPALVAAIKALKEVAGCGLVDAKLLIERGEIEFMSRRHYEEFVRQVRIQLRPAMSQGLSKGPRGHDEWFEVTLKGGG